MKIKKKKSPPNLNYALFSNGQGFVESIIKSNPEIIFKINEYGALEGMEPADTLYGYTYHANMIPPFKPDSMLMLGYGIGTVPELVRKIHGNIRVTGVDLNPSGCDYVEYKMVVADARAFMDECTSSIIRTRFDYIAVDLFKNDSVPDFVFTQDFADKLYIMSTRLVSINTKFEDFPRLKFMENAGFKFHRHVQVFGNIVSYWGV